MCVPLLSRCCISYIFSTIVSNENFKHAATLRSSLQNVGCFIMLTFPVRVLFTFYIHLCENLNVKFKVCKSVQHRTIQINHQPDATKAVNKRHDNKLENCCIWLVIYLNEM